MELKNFLFNEKEIRKMLTKEMVSIGGTKLGKLTFPNLEKIGNLSSSAYLNDAETTNYLGMNQHAIKHESLESPEEFAGKDIFYAEKRKQEMRQNNSIQWAHKVAGELEQTLLDDSLKLCTPNLIVDENGYCPVRPCIRMPVYEGKKIKAIFTSYIELTKYEHAESLYKRYKDIYSEDMKTGNRKFLEYLGFKIGNFVLARCEIEALIGLSKYRTNRDAARALGISAGTIEGYLQRIKSRLDNPNLTDILLHFTTNERRKF